MKAGTPRRRTRLLHLGALVRLWGAAAPPSDGSPIIQPQGCAPRSHRRPRWFSPLPQQITDFIQAGPRPPCDTRQVVAGGQGVGVVRPEDPRLVPQHLPLLADRGGQIPRLPGAVRQAAAGAQCVRWSRPEDPQLVLQASVRLLASQTSTAPNQLTAILTATPPCGAAREATAADVQNARDWRYGRRRTARWQLRCDYGSAG